MAKKVTLALVLAGFAAALGVAGIGFTIVAGSNNGTTIDESKLYIGILKDGDASITITAKSQNGQRKESFSSGELSPLEGQNEQIVFYDYAASPLMDMNSLEVGYWLGDVNNSITVTTCYQDVIISAEVEIDKSGMWFVALPETAGSVPQTSHAYCHKTDWNIFGG